jgi:hypothetical protein
MFPCNTGIYVKTSRPWDWLAVCQLIIALLQPDLKLVEQQQYCPLDLRPRSNYVIYAVIDHLPWYFISCWMLRAWCACGTRHIHKAPLVARLAIYKQQRA